MKKRCPSCGRLIEILGDGSMKKHSPVWKSPPPGAPLCSGRTKTNS